MKFELFLSWLLKAISIAFASYAGVTCSGGSEISVTAEPSFFGDFFSVTSLKMRHFPADSSILPDQFLVIS